MTSCKSLFYDFYLTEGKMPARARMRHSFSCREFHAPPQSLSACPVLLHQHLRRRASHLPRGQEGGLDHLCRPPGGLLLRLPVQGQPHRSRQLRLRSAQTAQAGRAGRMGAHRAGLGDRPSAAMLATGRTQALHGQRPGVQSVGGRPAQPGPGGRRGERRPQQLRLRHAQRKAQPVRRLPLRGQLQAAYGDAARIQPRPLPAPICT